MTKIALLSFFFLFAQAENIQSQNSTLIAAEHNQRHASYAQLNRQIFGQHDDPASDKLHVSQWDRIAAIRSQLHQLISDEINDVLVTLNPTADDVKNAIVAVQGESTDKPFANFFELNGIKSLAVGYIILQGDDAIADTQPYLEFYSRTNGNWTVKAAASTLSDFRGRTFLISAFF